MSTQLRIELVKKATLDYATRSYRLVNHDRYR